MNGLEPILTASEMHAADRHAIQVLGIPGEQLMESAGQAAAEIAETMRSDPRTPGSFAVLAGKGNNGGDGLVAARFLAQAGHDVQVLTLAGDRSSPETRENLRRIQALARKRDNLHLVADVDDLEEPDIAIDSLLGIGATGALREPLVSLCQWINRQNALVLAIDVPTGLNADTGATTEHAIRATRTVTFSALKRGLLLESGPEHCGTVDCVPIGIPEASLSAGAHRADGDWVSKRLPTRHSPTHKYTVGKLVAVVGSRSYSGAAVLATGAAMRIGSGAVIACAPASIRATIDAHWAEVMVAEQAETSSGGLATAATEEILSRTRQANALLIGCGLGRDQETQETVRNIVQAVRNVPVVIDADGLNALSGQVDILEETSGTHILTPHIGELRRLLEDPEFTPEDRLECAREWAQQWSSILVLKGMPTVVGTPEGNAYIGPPAEPALATAGSGDVLAGTIAGLLAQGMAPVDAVLAGLHLGTTAARRIRERGARTLIASDLLDELPYACSP